jgi:hypothetical protein
MVAVWNWGIYVQICLMEVSKKYWELGTEI